MRPDSIAAVPPGGVVAPVIASAAGVPAGADGIADIEILQPHDLVHASGVEHSTRQLPGSSRMAPSL